MNVAADQPVRILTIDDEPAARDCFRLFLEDLGYQVIEAENGRAGLRLFSEQNPDLVLVDLRMPGMDGLKVLSRLHHKAPEIPAIVVTGAGDVNDAIAALRDGAWDYLLKPIRNLNALQHAISKSLERSRLLQENREYQQGLKEQVAQRTHELRHTNNELISANLQLQQKEQKYRTIFESLQDVYFECRVDGTLLEISPSIQQLAAFDSSETLNQNFWELFIIPQEVENLIKKLKRNERIRNFEALLKSKDERVVPSSIVARMVKDRQGEPLKICGTIRDITENKMAEARIKHLAYFDSLTDLPNRRLLTDRIAHTLAHARRHQHFGALLFLDLDHFKTINDSLGHLIGDKLLIDVARRIGQDLRQEDTLSRLGGDEFVVLISDLGSEKLEAVNQARQAANKIREALSKPFRIDDHELHISTSIGVNIYPAEGMGIDDLMRQADSAMYRAKEEGRNRVKFFLPSMQTIANRRLVMEKGLRRAMDRKEFKLYFQPQVDKKGELHGTEVLLRWQHAKHGLLSPGDFIPVAETTGLILPIGEWVLQHSCEQLKSWLARGLGDEINRISVNVSPRQFHQRDFVHQVEEILKKTGLDPYRLQLEITEGVVINNVNRAIETMDALKNLGIRLSIDDFGTGYSSLAYLKRLPLDELKIDKSFIRNIADDRNSAAIVGAIIAMAQHLGLDVIAEGVETSSELTSLQQKGSRYFQGYYFSHPLPANEFGEMLETRSQRLHAPPVEHA